MGETISLDDYTVYTTLPGNSGATHSISLCIAGYGRTLCVASKGNSGATHSISLCIAEVDLWRSRTPSLSRSIGGKIFQTADFGHEQLKHSRS